MAKSKAGRNKDKCKRYREEGRREKNKKRRAEKQAYTIAKRAAKRRK